MLLTRDSLFLSCVRSVGPGNGDTPPCRGRNPRFSLPGFSLINFESTLDSKAREGAGKAASPVTWGEGELRSSAFLFSDACAERIFSPSFGTLEGSKPSGEFVVVVGDVE